MNNINDIVFPAGGIDQDRAEIARRFRAVGLNSIACTAELGYPIVVGHLRELYQEEARKRRDAT